ncbi:hypothetical protein QF021_004003 [Acidovorax delafieldii]|nr:hypothetical protein [Acidovorax delafieldii]
MYYGERFNSYSHLAGAVLSAAGAVVLIALAARLGDPWKVVSFSIYGAMLVALYGASTVYHSVRGRAKAVLQKLDHCSIYLLIAGSYTPFALVSLRGAWGWSLLGVVWGLALLGHCAGDLVGQRRARVVAGHLRADGVAGSGGRGAAVAGAHACRVCLAGSGRSVLHAGYRLLRHRPPGAAWSWVVAPVCAGRQQLPLCHGVVLRGLTLRAQPLWQSRTRQALPLLFATMYPPR